jgi:hypothetical protein
MEWPDFRKRIYRIFNIEGEENLTNQAFVGMQQKSWRCTSWNLSTLYLFVDKATLRNVNEGPSP